APPEGSHVVIVDAVDEAVSPGTLLSSLLLPLGRQAGLKVAVGTRRHVLSLVREVDLTIDLDTKEYRDPAALAEYIHRLLVASEEPGISTPYQQPCTGISSGGADDIGLAVAAAIAQRALTRDGAESFLIGRLLALSVRGRDEPIDITSDD